MIRCIDDKKLKKQIIRTILGELPEWFGIEESVEEYVRHGENYQSLGFVKFEVIPTLWDAHNPCQIYIKPIIETLNS